MFIHMFHLYIRFWHGNPWACCFIWFMIWLCTMAVILDFFYAATRCDYDE